MAAGNLFFRIAGNVHFWFHDLFCNFVLWANCVGVRLQPMNSRYRAYYHGSRKIVSKSVVITLTQIGINKKIAISEEFSERPSPTQRLLMLKNLRGRIYNIGCKLPIIRPYMQFVQQYLQPGVIYEKCSRFSLRSYASVRPFKLLNKYSVKLIF